MTDKGFSLLSMLLVLIIITSLLVLSLNRFIEPDNEYLYFMNDYLDCQSESMVSRSEGDLYRDNIHFYKTGRVNMARTVDFARHKVIVHLGNGYLTYE